MVLTASVPLGPTASRSCHWLLPSLGVVMPHPASGLSSVLDGRAARAPPEGVGVYLCTGF